MVLEGGKKRLVKNLNLPVVSIIIVTYNAALYLQACLESIHSQKYPNLEIIVIDGNSIDETIEILQLNSQHIDYWKSERDNGIYDAMNNSLSYATGEWIYFIGADDILFEEFSSMCYELKDSNAIYYGCVLTLGGSTFSVTDYQFVKFGICHQAIIYPRSIFSLYKFSVKYKISADYALNIQLYGKYHFKFRDFLIAKFNHTGVSSLNIDYPFEKDRSRLIVKNFGLWIWLRYLFWKIKKMFNVNKADADLR